MRTISIVISAFIASGANCAAVDSNTTVVIAPIPTAVASEPQVAPSATIKTDTTTAAENALTPVTSP